jgi:hypothetical protein
MAQNVLCIKLVHLKPNRKECLFVEKLNMRYTTEMEKAMQNSHGIGYEEYNLKHDVRMEVEQRREEDYLQSRRIVADIDRKVY